MLGSSAFRPALPILYTFVSAACLVFRCWGRGSLWNMRRRLARNILGIRACVKDVNWRSDQRTAKWKKRF